MKKSLQASLAALATALTAAIAFGQQIVDIISPVEAPSEATIQPAGITVNVQQDNKQKMENNIDSFLDEDFE